MPSCKLSDAQKTYWSNMNSKVDTPLQYGYYGGWEPVPSDAAADPVIIRLT